jgi:UDP-2-acetamido-2,6-beta-L-arabino-hexul-4-ose reductase
MKFGITGSAGMLGWHMRCYLKQFEDIEVVLADRSTFADPDALRRFVAGTDAIAHFAGQNRGDDRELAATNVDLAERLVGACEAEGVAPHVVYSSTVHAENDSAYGQSKKRAGEILRAWSDKSGAKFCNLVLPHIFGEGTRPFYNSAVATFAYQLATGDEPEVHNDATLELLHAQDVTAEVLRIVRQGDESSLRLAGEKITVSEVLGRLRVMARSYESLVVPDVRSKLDLRLFNLYRSYLFPDYYPKELELHSDDRGDLVEVVKNLNGGQAFFSTTKPGVTRGNHFHYSKIERFLVVRGSARIEVRKLFDDDAHVFDVSGEAPAFVDMPPLHTHSITNTGEEQLLTLFWAHEIFEPAKPDTVFEPV